jgi:hypothetical protein
MQEFEKMWLNKLSNSLSRNFGAAFSKDIFNQLDLDHGKLETTRSILNTFMDRMPESKIHDTLTEATCYYPHSELIQLKKLYASTQDLTLVHSLLQKKFEQDIVIHKNLNQADLSFIKKHHWGIAGQLNGNQIIATKIPAEFQKYFLSKNQFVKRSHYCHCPRIKEAIKSGEDIPYRYCYCGGGYYRDIWRYITDKPVNVEIMKSLLLGDEVCQFKIIIQL